MKLHVIIATISFGVFGFGGFCLGSEVKFDEKQISRKDLLSLVSADDTDLCVFAEGLIDKCYEANPRSVKNVRASRYGQVFPLHPEVLYDVMKFSRGKKVLEIGAASGECSLLIGLAGAKQVYVNDIEPCELKLFKENLKKLPKDVQKKFTCLQGDCFEVFNDEKFTETFDVIYARNIFHFFSGKKRERLIKIVERLLKPGGRFIIAVNSALQGAGKEMCKKYPEAYIFKRYLPMLRQASGNQLLAKDIVVEMNLEEVDPFDYKFQPLIRFTSEGIVKKDFFEELSEKLQGDVMKVATLAFEQYGSLMLKLANAKIDCHEAHIICYAKNTLEKAFSDSKLEIFDTGSIDAKGHMTANDDEEVFLSAMFEKK